MKLLPIGTEFTTIFSPSMCSTDTRSTAITYKVVAHDRCARFPGDEVGELCERLESTKVIDLGVRDELTIKTN